jgi:maltose O-acetyltransferase
MTKRLANRDLGALQWVRVLFYEALSTGHSEGNARKTQPVLILGDGLIQFEKGVTFGYFPSPFFLAGYIHLEARSGSSLISIGEGTQINNNFVAVAEHTSITIGKRCLVGTNVEILDSDFHGIRVNQRDTSDPRAAKPVMIGSDVLIGSNVKIMKGVVIGSGSVIANSAVVVGAVPPGVVAGGNPARVLRTIEG